MEFGNFTDLVRQQFVVMSSGELYEVEMDKDELYNLYLSSFPEGTNPIHKERHEYDCNTCKSFIRNVGNVVSIVDGKLVTVWDVNSTNEFKVVADALAAHVRNKFITMPFLHTEPKIGVSSNVVQMGAGADISTVTFSHFSCVLPNKFYDTNRASNIGSIMSNYDVFVRGLSMITLEALDIVLDLIDQNSIYRGAEFKSAVLGFKKLKSGYLNLITDKDKNIFVWGNVNDLSSRIRNTVIGTLLDDLSNRVNINDAIRSFESKVAPSNYKRTSAPITKGMIDNAVNTIRELGYEEALQRRYATISDISVNNVLFADKMVSPAMKDSLTNMLTSEVKTSSKQLDKVEEVSIEEFINNIVPNVNSIELMLDNSHIANMVSIIAPADSTAKNILKWDNNFSWSYNGEVTDSMKERVKAAGGNINAELRFSIQWNENGDNKNDYDAHAIEPNGNHIWFSNKGSHHPSSGMLDVDIVHPDTTQVAVENITWVDKGRMPEGVYELYVNNYNHRGGRNGFRAEIEFNGSILSFDYNQDLPNNADIEVAQIKFSKTEGFSVVSSLPNTKSSKEVWGVKTNSFVKVSAMMLSPNFWDEQTIGNKHYMFILDECNNPDDTRGLYNEFLKNELTPHRKVFEVLSSKLKCKHSIDQLSGVGFSSTQENSIVCRVTGNFTRTLKIKF